MRPRPTIVAAASALAILSTALTVTPAHSDTHAEIHFDQSLGLRSPDIFGGTINVLEDPADIDSLRSVGVTAVRRDLYLTEILPNTSVSQYLTDLGDVSDPSDDTGVANPATWDWSKYGWVDMYRSKGLRLMLIMSYNVPWLAASGTDRGVPTNWTVYNDVIRKIYTRFQDDATWVEIWNEPDIGFLDITGSGKASRLEAYQDIYANAAATIHGVNPDQLVGGPVTSVPDTTWVEALLTNPATKDHVDFLSFHRYLPVPDGESVINDIRGAAASRGYPDLPIYMTEWNFSAGEGQSMNNDSTDAIPYVAQRIDNMLRQNLTGAMYYAMNKIPRDPNWYSVNPDGSLTPKMNTWRVLSKQLGLGDGPFDLRDGSWTNGSATVLSAGAVNSAGTPVGWVINTATSGDTLSMTFTGLTPGTQYSAAVYEASAGNNGANIRNTVTFTTNSAGAGTTTVSIPAKSVLGFKLTDADTRIDLAEDATTTADSTFDATGQYAPAKATDGNGSTRWTSAASAAPHWLKVDLGTSKALNEVAVEWNPAYAVSYTIQTSNDNSTWTTRATVTGNGSPGTKVAAFPTVTARYVRVHVTAAQSEYADHVGVYSFNVYNDLARGGVASQDSTFDTTGTYAAARAFDGDDLSRAATGTGPAPHWIQVDLGTNQTVRTARVHWDPAYGVDYQIQTSADGATWTTRATVTGNPGEGWRASNFSPVTARYVRVNVTTTAWSGAHVSAYTINVY